MRMENWKPAYDTQLDTVAEIMPDTLEKGAFSVPSACSLKGKLRHKWQEFLWSWGLVLTLKLFYFQIQYIRTEAKT